MNHQNASGETIEEKLWLVNENDEPIGEGWHLRSNGHPERVNWQNFRVVNAFVRNTEGQIWVPRRSPTKRLMPNYLDMSVGGHVTFPESYEVAFGRETAEEIGLDISKYPVRFLGKWRPVDHGLSAWGKVWEISADEVSGWNRNDFSEVTWMTPQELADRLDGGDKGKGDLRILIRLSYGV